MTPQNGYGLTASLQSFAWSALVGYPSAAVTTTPGFSPNNGLWLLITITLGLALSIYSAMPKHRFFLMVNWLVIPCFSIALFWICWKVNPAAVGNNAGMVLMFSIFTFGGPLWIPVGATILHFIFCISVPKELAPDYVAQPGSQQGDIWK